MSQPRPQVPSSIPGLRKPTATATGLPRKPSAPTSSSRAALSPLHGNAMAVRLGKSGVRVDAKVAASSPLAHGVKSGSAHGKSAASGSGSLSAKHAPASKRTPTIKVTPAKSQLPRPEKAASNRSSSTSTTPLQQISSNVTNSNSDNVSANSITPSDPCNSGTRARFRDGAMTRLHPSVPADMDSPTFQAYKRAVYPDEQFGSRRCTPSKLTAEDLSRELHRLSIGSAGSATHVTPDRVQMAARLLQRSASSRRSGTPVKGLSGSGSGKTSSLLYTPNTWIAKKAAEKRKANYDRFIPNRTAMDMSSSQFQVQRADSTGSLTCSSAAGALPATATDVHGEVLDAESLAYQYQVAQACGLALDRRILAFHEQPPVNDKEDLKAKYSRPVKATTATGAVKRKIPTVPERVLDAPGILDDYYLNLLDWSSSNILAVGLGSAVYLWNASSGTVDELCSLDAEEPVTSLSWCQDGAHLAIADSNGETQLWNVESKALMRTLRGAPSRIGSLAWNRQTLSTGTRDGSIHNHDVRLADSGISDMLGHEGDVCGLKWSPEGSQLASGGNDNLVNIWDARTTTAKYTKRDHQAAVKALAWCPWQSNLLATGGGSDDRKICFWNTASGARQSRIDTGSQVTGLLWSKTYRELISSHGFSENQLTVWKYPTMQKVVEVPHAHDSRILHMTISPDGQTVCSGAADENLKFWKVFAMDEKFVKTKGSSTKSAGGKGGAGAGGASSSSSGAQGKGGNKKSPDFGGSISIR